MQKRRVRIIKCGLTILGIGLLVLPIYGLIFDPIVPSEPRYEGDIPGHDYVLREEDELLGAINEPVEHFDLAQTDLFRYSDHWPNIPVKIAILFEPPAPTSRT